MVAKIADVASEVDKVVNAPFVVDIAPLYNVVRNIGDDAIGHWCYAKESQIANLVSYLIKRLPDDRGLEILERFCRATNLPGL